MLSNDAGLGFDQGLPADLTCVTRLGPDSDVLSASVLSASTEVLQRQDLLCFFKDSLNRRNKHLYGSLCSPLWMRSVILV